MKKLLLGLILIAALVGVVYLKSERSTQRRENIVRESFQAGASAGEKYKGQADSLNELVGLQDSLMAESMAVRDQLHASEVDSLNQTIESQEQKIADLNSQLKASQSAPKLTAKASSSSSTSKHREILEDYKKAVSDLPGDLSAYERRVALSEIRNETARKYAISLAQLNSLRKENNLDY